MSDSELFFYIWLSGFILSLPILIYWANYKELDGRTVVDLRKIVIILCGAIIGNWGIVSIYLWAVGMWLLVKIGEWCERICDITFYDSGKEESKEKKRTSKGQREEVKEQREERHKWWETKQDYRQMCTGITSHINHCIAMGTSPEKTFIDGNPLNTEFFIVTQSSACKGFGLNYIKTAEWIHVYSIDFYDYFNFINKNKEERNAKSSVSIQGLREEEYLAIIKTVIETGNFNIKREDIIKQKK